MTKSPLTAHLDSAPLYTRTVRYADGRTRTYAYGTVAQLRRLLMRDWLSDGLALSDQERKEIVGIIEKFTDKEDSARINMDYNQLIATVDKNLREIIEAYPGDLTRMEQKAKEQDDQRAQALLIVLEHVWAAKSEIKGFSTSK